jgi:hypothetical protein
MSLDDHDPFDYFSDEKVPEKEDQSSSSDIVNSLRSDILASSEVEPAEVSIVHQINYKLIGGAIIGFVIICLILYLLVGAGRNMLERSLSSLKSTAPTSTIQNMPKAASITETPEKPTNTPTRIPTSRPTNTQIIELIASQTQIPATVTPTADSSCRDALTITLADIGQTLCVQGTIIETVDRPTNFMVIFSTEKGSFYWVTYDLVWSQAELDTCYRTTGTIDQIANSPVLVFGYSNLPELCP